MTGEKSRKFTQAAALAVLTMLAASPALADSTPQNSPAVDSVPEKTAPQTAPAKNLSEKLDQSQGVLHPKDVDPGMQKPAPATGTHDVIKPPGTPGGPPAPIAK